MKTSISRLGALFATTSVIALAAGCGSDDETSSTTTTATQGTTTTQRQGGPGGAGGPGGGAGTQGQDQVFDDVKLNTDGVGSGGANTAAVVKATNAFLATLDTKQRATATYDLDDYTPRVTWSNYPSSNVPRPGIALGDLNATQKTAALAVVRAFSGASGYAQILDIFKADAYLASTDQNGKDEYGEKHYSLAVYDTPSTTTPFAVQFGGHHVARNLTYNGDDVSGAPNFTGTEPTSFPSGGTTLSPMKPEVDAAFDMITSLSSAQQAAAKLSEVYDNPVKGPGEDDGVYPKAEGVLVSDLDQADQARVSKLLRLYVGDINEDAADAIMKTYESGYSKTRISWATSTDPTVEGAYIRVDGPSAWLEFSVQHGASTPGVHYHTVYRDKNDDYGSSNPST